MAEHDLIIRGGSAVDGTGAAARTADVAVSDGIVTAVGKVAGTGRQELDADGLLVTPGFVDIHVHYAGQATWDNRLNPSSWPGVTPVVASRQRGGKGKSGVSSVDFGGWRIKKKKK